MLNSLSEQATTEDTHFSNLLFSPTQQTHSLDQDLETKETNKFILAKSFFDHREFLRCVGVFLPPGNVGADIPLPPGATLDSRSFESLISRGISQKALFLALYGLFMAGEKQKIVELGEPLSPSDSRAVVNKQMVHAKRVLSIWFRALENDPKTRTRSGDGYLEYLYGMIYAREANKDLAKTWLILSVERNPWNWGAWLELSRLIVSKKEFDDLQSEHRPIFQHYMAGIFLLYCRHKLHDLSTSFLRDLAVLQMDFPGNHFLSAQRALTLCRLREYENANSLYWHMRVENPKSLDFVEQHSNLLWEMRKKETASLLAKGCSDRSRPETCLVVSNYRSLEGRREDAIKYFRKAVTLDRGYSGAWTLLGREYYSLKNYSAALASWHRALEVDPHDDRALVAIGKCLCDHLANCANAVQYYHRALKLNRARVGLWQLLADCYVDMGRLPDAIKALESALDHSLLYTDETKCSSEKFVSFVRFGRIKVLKQLAQFYFSNGDQSNAIEALQSCLDACIKHLDRANTKQEVRRELINDIIPQVEDLMEKWTQVESEADEEADDGGDQDGSDNEGDWYDVDESDEDELD